MPADEFTFFLLTDRIMFAVDETHISALNIPAAKFCGFLGMLIRTQSCFAISLQLILLPTEEHNLVISSKMLAKAAVPMSFVFFVKVPKKNRCCL